MTHNRREIETKARALLAKFKIVRAPVPVEEIAQGLGARVSYSPLDAELSGMVFIRDGDPIIGVNASHSRNRQRFTVAHEIAHLVLHRQQITDAVHVDKRFSESFAPLNRDARSSLGTKSIEIEANQFAAALLMPRELLEPALADFDLDIEDEEALQQLARQFKVSTAALQYRIRSISTAAAKLPKPRTVNRV
jgi:Zn-dependent peptidase ImmA (M78 family)